MHVLKIIANLMPLLAAATLASCTSVAPDPFLTTQAVSPDVAPTVTDVSADYAAAYLPSYAGAIESVRQTVSNNALHQEIVYANQTGLAGENVLTVDIGPPEQAGLLRPPSQARVRGEMRSAFPGVGMSLSPLIGDNASGSFGYATATVGGGACVYAWQYVRQVTPADSTGFAKFTRRHLGASIRLRYCHPSITADRIHVLMDGLRLKDINSQTIDMLRFAAGTADVAQPVAVVTPEPVVRKRRTVRQADVASNDDWRKPQAQKLSNDAGVAVVDNAVAVPLPDGTAERPVVVASPDVVAKPEVTIDNAATVPLPQ
jgi:hypothetical protein